MIRESKKAGSNHPIVTIEIRAGSGTPMTRIAWAKFWGKLLAAVKAAELPSQSSWEGAAMGNDERNECDS